MVAGKHFTWGRDLSGSRECAGGVGGLMAITEKAQGDAKSKTYYPLYDASGNVGQLLSESGEVSAAYEYNAFGETTRAAGELAESNPWKFSTKAQDDETTFYYYGFRYYDPVTGRWPNRDPIEEREGTNLYAFVGNDWINRVDKFGLSVQWTNKPTVHEWINSASSTQNPGRVGDPNSSTSSVRDGVFGRASAQWDIKTDDTLECECVTRNSKKIWIIKKIAVDFWAIQYLREELKNGGEYRGVTFLQAWTAEQQHVDDFYRWANTRLKPHADQWLTEYRAKKEFVDKDSCEARAPHSLNLNIEDSFRLAQRASNDYWDGTDRHNSNSPNFLQGSPPNLPANPNVTVH